MLCEQVSEHLWMFLKALISGGFIDEPEICTSVVELFNLPAHLLPLTLDKQQPALHLGKWESMQQNMEDLARTAGFCLSVCSQSQLQLWAFYTGRHLRSPLGAFANAFVSDILLEATPQRDFGRVTCKSPSLPLGVLAHCR